MRFGDEHWWKCGPPPASGQRQRYPGRFEYNLHKYYPQFKEAGTGTLHLFSGACEWGTTSDLRPETGADIIGEFDKLPIARGQYENVLADPPYADYFMDDWDGRPLPRPIDVLRAAARYVKPGGLIGILTIIIIPEYKHEKWDMPGIERLNAWPIMCGSNNAARVFNVFRRVE